ncbi:bifunctional methylenetetrahydrofolate dehydrogenase/methenyltetrahydrofolate cyclohydrolase FolD [Azospirillum halopraeferens]|uniref:bifunctional methylenetetrahydrofolate dehydrogenase/methenyltetrahydrofolate cyclohydrolase FolD n=1 Tax=Azospirillum halopraeferens TaxID=34010 RepID=UPI000400DD01|nr:bifunctional methylenetetrahydrofolate dehydrogenase/methenyltetrahydrofolate cyclohydrolase FolD [Azospirillum halopraeferens]
MGEARIIDGKGFAAGLRARVGEGVAALKAGHGVTPGLGVVLVGDDPASQVYVRSKEKALVELGMNSIDHHLPATTTQAELLALIDALNADPAVHGILVQLPLPRAIDTQAVLGRIAPAKDADGFHVVNAGLLATGQAGATIPCTPWGCMLLIRDVLGRDLSGRRALVIGRSNIVGKPMGQLLLQADCTVTMAHSRTRDLADECRRADILVAAVGRPEMVRGDWIKPGAVVIDVGMNRIPADQPGKTRLVGDVAFDEARAVAGAITPVPGGVGPMTIACLMLNTLTAACRAAGAPLPAEAAP